MRSFRIYLPTGRLLPVGTFVVVAVVLCVAVVGDPFWFVIFGALLAIVLAACASAAKKGRFALAIILAYCAATCALLVRHRLERAEAVAQVASVFHGIVSDPEGAIRRIRWPSNIRPPDFAQSYRVEMIDYSIAGTWEVAVVFANGRRYYLDLRKNRWTGWEVVVLSGSAGKNA